MTPVLEVVLNSIVDISDWSALVNGGSASVTAVNAKESFWTDWVLTCSMEYDSSRAVGSLAPLLYYVVHKKGMLEREAEFGRPD